MIDQIITIDIERIVKVLGEVEKSEIKEIKSVIKEMFVD
ncbi:MAG: hypothetical protein HRT66_01395 [Flavobacteriaceae bacterium]|nr:hypothetical protein [Flavobacteriaceae bacterium]